MPPPGISRDARVLCAQYSFREYRQVNGLWRFIPDGFSLALVGAVVLASLFPAEGWGAFLFDQIAILAIGLLFFMHGARLSRAAVIQGLTHWRLHLFVLGATFVLFPVLGVAGQLLFPDLLQQPLWLGVLFVCALPSTVQSSIAFTSIARGNVSAAVCAAAASNLLGIVITPLLVGMMLHLQGGGFSLAAVGKIALQLLAPFLAGHLLRPWLAGWVQRRRRLLSFTDRGSILLVVYNSFSVAVQENIWQRVGLGELCLLVLVNTLLLGLVMATTHYGARLLRFSREDEIAILFCGSKKSMASGIPMALVLFPGASAGLTLLPLMLFHQGQLMLCAWLARLYANRS